MYCSKKDNIIYTIEYKNLKEYLITSHVNDRIIECVGLAKQSLMIVILS